MIKDNVGFAWKSVLRHFWCKIRVNVPSTESSGVVISEAGHGGR